MAKKTKTLKAKSAPKKKAKRATAPAVTDPRAKSDTQFLIETFDQVKGKLADVEDPERKKALKARLDALRSKFKGLPKTKQTSERAQRYGEELHKIAADIISACCT